MSLEGEGFELVHEVLDSAHCAQLARHAPADGGAGTRRVLDEGWCRALARELSAHPALAAHLPMDAVATQCTWFDKSEAQNWLVAWHQDTTIAVADKPAALAHLTWSSKEGLTCVQPPRELLQQLLAVRLHLDASEADNGPLRVIPGSHRHGRLDTAQSAALRESTPETTCLAPQGSALLLRPLLLHASSKATSDRPRRVLHFLYGPARLPLDLRWHWSV